MSAKSNELKEMTVANCDHDDAAICAENLRLAFLNLLSFYSDASDACRAYGCTLPSPIAAQRAKIEALGAALVTENTYLLRVLPATVLADFASRVACPV